MVDSSDVAVIATFEAFYADEYPGQLRRAFLLLGNRADAAEATADAFASVFSRWLLIDQPGPYLNRCVLNACRDVGRRRGRGQAERLPNDLVESARTEEVEFADLLLTLNFKQRSMVVMRYYGGLNETEIADALQCRPGSVGPTIHRALTKLRGALQ